jgi:hypothetical protein
MGDILLFALGLPSMVLVIDLGFYLFKGRRLLGKVVAKIVEVIVVIGLPVLYLSVLDFGLDNDCCNESATFSPEHQLSIYILIVLCMAAYFYSSYRHSLAPPVLEVIVNAFLLIAIGLNVFIGIHVEPWLGALGNLPIVILYIFMLIKNQQLLMIYANRLEINTFSPLERYAWKFLSLKPITKIPLLFVLCLPILMVLSAVLLLFGQKPDSMIRAFTDTYRHGLSQWDYMCENVTCGGHFLCSVAAQGHTQLVKPQRMGERGGHRIVCNRQLLIANAFEELLEQHLPRTHRLIRRKYNRVGNLIHCYYGVFSNPYVADLIYLLMKPLEWTFLAALYTFDRQPENRIAQQYLNPTDRKHLKNVV